MVSNRNGRQTKFEPEIFRNLQHFRKTLRKPRYHLRKFGPYIQLHETEFAPALVIAEAPSASSVTQPSYRIVTREMCRTTLTQLAQGRLEGDIQRERLSLRQLQAGFLRQFPEGKRSSNWHSCLGILMVASRWCSVLVVLCGNVPHRDRIGTTPGQHRDHIDMYFPAVETHKTPYVSAPFALD